jgi:hypothetical protein
MISPLWGQFARAALKGVSPILVKLRLGFELMKIAVSSFTRSASREIFRVRNSSSLSNESIAPEQLWITRSLRGDSAITARCESARIEIEAVAGSARAEHASCGVSIHQIREDAMAKKAKKAKTVKKAKKAKKAKK